MGLSQYHEPMAALGDVIAPDPSKPTSTAKICNMSGNRRLCAELIPTHELNR